MMAVVLLSPGPPALAGVEATITIVKETLPNVSNSAFAFSSTIPGAASFVLAGDTASATFVVTGSGLMTVTEGQQAGWNLTAITCSEGAGNVPNRTATMQVDPGDAIICTFTNTLDADAATFTIVKEALPDHAQDFGFTTSGFAASFSLDDDADPSLARSMTWAFILGFGMHAVTEASTAGWSLTDINCTEGLATAATATVQVDPGDRITCTFTNTLEDGLPATPVPTPTASETPTSAPRSVVPATPSPTPAAGLLPDTANAEGAGWTIPLVGALFLLGLLTIGPIAISRRRRPF